MISNPALDRRLRARTDHRLGGVAHESLQGSGVAVLPAVGEDGGVLGDLEIDAGGAGRPAPSLAPPFGRLKARVALGVDPACGRSVWAAMDLRLAASGRMRGERR